MEQLKTTVIDYGEGIYGIDQQMVRAFLVVGTKRAVLLDTGAVPVDLPSLIRGITDLPLTVILTHGDGDHIGNLHFFAEAYVNENDREAVHSHPDCAAVRLLSLDEGDVFDVGGRKLKVLFTPGHTKGSVCLIDEADRRLFGGDTISYGPVFMFGARRDMPQYLASLTRLEAMARSGEYTVVYPCHNICPVPSDTASELIACVSGILDGTIVGEVARMPLPTEQPPLLGRLGNCSVLFERNNK